MQDSSATNASLIFRLRESRFEDATWQEFVERYGSKIYAWCLSRRLQTPDAEDVTQEVIFRIARKFEEFEYNPKKSFRGWLRTITENAIIDFFRSTKGRQLIGSSAQAVLEDMPARQQLTEQLEEAFDLEIFELAKARVEARVLPSRWQSWHLTAEQGVSGKDVALKLDISVASVYANKNQVQNMIREEVMRLEDPDSDR